MCSDCGEGEGGDGRLWETLVRGGAFGVNIFQHWTFCIINKQGIIFLASN